MINILNRTQAPSKAIPGRLSTIDTIPAFRFGTMPFYLIEGGEQEITRIEVVFKAGTRFEEKPLVASICNALLKEGTRYANAAEIAETLEYYGAALMHEVTKDRASVMLVCLTKFLPEVLPVLAGILTAPVFDTDELNLYKRKAKSRLEVNLQKVEFNCRILFSGMIFKDIPYRDDFRPEDFDTLERSDIKTFFDNHYNLNEAFCIITGHQSVHAGKSLRNALSEKISEPTSPDKGETDYSWNYEKQEQFLRKPGALQSAIRVGAPAPGRREVDYPAFYFLNTALGGYFGSRLMQNIREEKGFTYGVGSSSNSLEKASVQVISTQVGVKHTEATITEIRKELLRLADPMDLEELDQIKYYLAGNLLQQLDGPFERANRLKTLICFGLDPDYYQVFLSRIFALRPEQLQETAKKYFNPDRYSLAVVGEM